MGGMGRDIAIQSRILVLHLACLARVRACVRVRVCVRARARVCECVCGCVCVCVIPFRVVFWQVSMRAFQRGACCTACYT